METLCRRDRGTTEVHVLGNGKRKETRIEMEGCSSLGIKKKNLGRRLRHAAGRSRGSWLRDATDWKFQEGGGPWCQEAFPE